MNDSSVRGPCDAHSAIVLAGTDTPGLRGISVGGDPEVRDPLALNREQRPAVGSHAYIRIVRQVVRNSSSGTARIRNFPYLIKILRDAICRRDQQAFSVWTPGYSGYRPVQFGID